MNSNNQGRKSQTNSRRNKAIEISIQERRRKVAELLQQSLSETAISQQLGVDLSTVSYDVKALKEQAIQFVYSLAKTDLAFFYKSTIDDINKARTEAWKVYNSCRDQQKREKLLALKIVITSNESMFNLLSQGPVVMSVKAMEERLSIVEGARQPI
jgi:IS30 family transposase